MRRFTNWGFRGVRGGRGESWAPTRIALRMASVRFCQVCLDFSKLANFSIRLPDACTDGMNGEPKTKSKALTPRKARSTTENLQPSESRAPAVAKLCESYLGITSGFGPGLGFILWFRYPSSRMLVTESAFSSDRKSPQRARGPARFENRYRTSKYVAQTPGLMHGAKRGNK